MSLILPPLSQTRRVELVVNEEGQALLLHVGDLDYQYDWVQYDVQRRELVFVTHKGDTHSLGMTLFPPFLKSLKKSCGLGMVKIKDNGAFGSLHNIPLMGMVDECSSLG